MSIYLYIWTVWIILNLCFCEDPKKKEEAKNKYQTYEYGIHTEGEKISLKHKGVIPYFQPIYNITIKPSVGFGSFTYLKAECLNPISKVTFNYDATSSVMTMHVEFPFLQTPYGILGYSMPVDFRVIQRIKILKSHN